MDVVRIPASTYRLQLNEELTFPAAARLVPYLARLGISDLYSSPMLAAGPGSTHGYDIADFGRVNPRLGGDEGFRELAGALAAHAMGLVVDLVPNHMGVAQARANPWWWDVLENGQCSSSARYFDIDWDPAKPELAGKVLLPILGDQYGRVLERGELRLELRDGALVLRYWEHELPVSPSSAPLVWRCSLPELEAELGAEDPDLRELLSILTALDNLPAVGETDPERIALRQREKEVARERLARLAERAERVRGYLEGCVRAANGTAGDPASFDLLHRLLEAQPYRLAYWRTAFHEINYRRFFDQNGLAAVRVEEQPVFEAIHGFVLGLLREGAVTGLRIDHIDGLYDPLGYLRSLVAGAATARGLPAWEGRLPAYVVVEKILSPGESLRDPWPVHGTTGYEFLNLLTGLLVDPGSARRLLSSYQRFSGLREGLEEVVYQSKKVVMETSLASEVNVLAHSLARIAERHRHSRDFTFNSLRDMLLEVIACFPVYRTYVAQGVHDAEDERVIERAVGASRRRNPAMDPSIFDFFRDVMLDRSPPGLAEHDRDARRRFAMKFQQYTGPVQAKGLEDTGFYRFHALISLNEVGGPPAGFATRPEEFHAANAARRARWPHSMLCTATHDTKRGEDTRARLCVLTELIDEWPRTASRWARINAGQRTAGELGVAPDHNDEYLFYQTLLGAWPAGEADVPALVERLRAHMIKAIREAKVHTSWQNENRAYEDAVGRFVEEALLGRRASRFLDAFLPFQRRIARAGAVNSLAQLVWKLTAPGVPDFYQGTELWDLSLVDPDNRRPVDFAARERLLAELEPLLDPAAPAAERAAGVAELLRHWEDGRIKLYVTACGLRLRRERADLFRAGDYLPLAAEGERAESIVAAARSWRDQIVLTVAPRLAARLAGGEFPLGRDAWKAVRLLLAEPLASRTYVNALTGAEHVPGDGRGGAGLAVADLLRECPVALLIAR